LSIRGPWLSWQHRRGNERGAALVEFVVILPLFVILVMGLVSGGTLYNHKSNLVNAAREGARYGATIPQNQCTPSANCGGQTWAQLVQLVVTQRSNGDLTTGQVCVALVSGSNGTVVGDTSQSSFTTNGTSQCYNDGNGDTGTRVQVSARRTGDAINLAFSTIPVTLTTSSTAKFEQ